MATMEDHTLSVERVIAAPPADIFAVLADAGQHSRIDGSGTVRGLKGASEPLALGSVFGMKMHMILPYSTKNTVVEFEPDRAIAWRTDGFGGLVGGRVWRYELEPVDGGTRVRETWDLRHDRQRALLERTKMPAKAKKDMRRTLERLAELLEG